MATWTEFADAAPELAAQAEKRLVETGLMMLATLRRDGSPRVSPMEPVLVDDKLVLRDGRLWLGMMAGATKSLDLQRDGRFMAHCATVDKMVTEDDVKFWGVATPVTDHDQLTAFAEDIFKSTGYRFEVGQFDAFEVDLDGASSVGVAGDAMVVRTWRAGKGVTVTEKRN